jgi:hypothetical protein
VVFDTSIIHSTENFSDRTRYVLLIRFWHPELSPTEIDAFKFIFDYLDHASIGDEALEQFEMMHLMMGKEKPLQRSPQPSSNINSVSDSRNSRRQQRSTGKQEIEKSKSAGSSPPIKRGFGTKKGMAF